MGQVQSRNYNFEDVQYIIKCKQNSKTNTTILINVLKEYEQGCLIKHTIDVKNEVKNDQGQFNVGTYRISHLR